MAAIDLTQREVLQSQEFIKLGVFSAWFGAIAVTISAVTQIARPEYEPLMIMIRLMLTALTAASIMYLAARAGKGVAAASLPLIINIGIVLLVLFMPFDRIWESASFHVNRGSYHFIAEQTLRGNLLHHEDGWLTLPSGYKYLSEGGQIYLSRQDGAASLFFFIEKGGDKGYAGYFYRSDGRLPSSAIFDPSVQWTRVEQRAPGWFYCTTGE